MKLYLANGIYFGTQAEAKKADPNFEPEEVPTDKEGLIAYLNGLAKHDPSWVVDEGTDCTPVVTRNDPKWVDPDDASPLTKEWFETAERHEGMTLDELFEQAPITRQIDLAVGAMDRANAALRSLVMQPANPVMPELRSIEDDEMGGSVDDELFQ